MQSEESRFLLHHLLSSKDIYALCQTVEVSGTALHEFALQVVYVGFSTDSSYGIFYTDNVVHNVNLDS